MYRCDYKSDFGYSYGSRTKGRQIGAPSYENLEHGIWYMFLLAAAIQSARSDGLQSR